MIQVRSIIVLASCIMGICVGAWEIDTDKTTKDPLVVALGLSFQLICAVKETNTEAQDNWKVCTWSRENDDARCVFTYKYRPFSDNYEIDHDCTNNTRMNDAGFIGSGEHWQEHNFKCGIMFAEAKEDDIVGWTCDLEQCASKGCERNKGSGTIANATIHLVVRHY